MMDNQKRKEEGFADKVVERTLDIFFNKDKTKLIVLCLFIAAFIIRLIAANNLELTADDSNGAVMPIGIMQSGKLEEIGQSSGLWFYIQELFYKIFGTSMLDTRIATVLFGSLTVILMFLFVKYVLKSKKIALIASALVAFSPFFIKMTLPEMDIAVNFFILFAGFMLFKHLQTNKKRHLFFSAILMGIAIMIKVYALFFAFSYTLFLLYSYYKKKSLNKKSLKIIFIFLCIMFLFCVPTLTYNYLLYKDKGIVDLMFTNFFKIGVEKAKQYHPQLSGFMPPTDFRGFFLGNQWNYKDYTEPLYRLPGFIVMLVSYLREDPVLILFGLLGLLLLIFKKDNKYLPFFLINFIIPFIFLGTQIPMLKHQTFAFIFFIPIASSMISSLHDTLSKKIGKIRLRHIILLILLINLLWLGRGDYAIKRHFYDTSADSQLVSYKIDNINPNALVVVDARIYRGFNAYMFNDRYYLESSLLNTAIDESSKYGTPTQIETYFVECVEDDCGWGTIGGQPEFNQSMELIVSWFANNSKVVAEMEDYGRYKYYLPFFSRLQPQVRYRVYKTNIIATPAILQLAQSTHIIINTFPVGYDEKIAPMYDDYEIYNSLDGLLDKFAHLIMYLAMAIALFAGVYSFIIFLMENENINNNTSL